MTLEQRMDRLERQVRWHRKIALVLVMAVAAALSMGQTNDFEYIICRGLTVVNEKGDRVAALKSWKLGGVLYIYGVNGYSTTIIAQNDGGDGFLETSSSSGKELVKLSSGKGGGILETFSSSGKKIVDLGTTTSGDGILTTYSSSGKKPVKLGAHKDVGGALSVFNKTGEAVCTMHPEDYGNGVIGAWNRKGKGRTLESR